MIETSPAQERLRRMVSDAQAVAAWLEYRHPDCTPTLWLTWSQQVERIRHVSVIGDKAYPDPQMSAEAARAMAALGWTRTRNRHVVPFIVTAPDSLSQHQRLAAVARIEEALRRP
jgi:hypothetical protein